MRAGAKLMQKKDYARAILEFRSAVQATPKDANPTISSPWRISPRAISAKASLVSGKPRNSIRSMPRLKSVWRAL